MSEIFLYLGKSSICLSLMLLFFVVLLRKETFLKLNRWILLANILLALMLPLLKTPTWLADFEMATTMEQPENNKIPITASAPTVANDNIPTVTNKKNTPWNWEAIGLSIYLIGFLIFLLRFLAQILSILFLIIGSEREKKENILFVYPGKILAPFSFFGFLFIDKNAYDPTSLEQIIAHEKVHIRQGHSWDILLSELLIIIQWFNPFAWWHRKLVETNLEYLADQNLLQSGTDPKIYQYNLLQIAVPNFPYSLATNYNSSLLKKRIMMMQQKKSSVAQSWKYFLLLPAVLMIWMAFGNTDNRTTETPFISVITADATEMDIRAAQEAYRKMEATLVINELKFDEENQLSDLNISSLSGERGDCTSCINGFESYSYIFYKRINKNSFKCGSVIPDKDLKMMEDPDNWNFVFINGQRPTQQKIDKLKTDTEKWRTLTKEKIKNTSPRSTGSTTYTNISATEEASIAAKIAAVSTKIYYLDGLKTDQTMDDLNYENIRSVKLNERQTNYYDRRGELINTIVDTIEIKIISQ